MGQRDRLLRRLCAGLLLRGLVYWFTLLAGQWVCCAAQFYVSPAGRDDQPGTREKPFASLDHACRQLGPGDVLWLAAGRYHEPLQLEGLRGTPDRPIVVRAMPGSEVVLDGTVPLELRWTRHRGEIWKAAVPQPVWQLFDGERMLIVARWPNAQMGELDFWNQKATWRKMAPESCFGLVIDQRPKSDPPRGYVAEDEGASWGVRLPEGMNTQSLAETGVDMTGAVAVMNMGSWMTWAQFIERHEPGSNRFTYSKDFSGQDPKPSWGERVRRWCEDQEFWDKKNTRGGQAHYFLEGLPCLDAPGEWWLDAQSRTLYLIPPKGKQPHGLRLRGKVVTYMVDMRECSYLVLDGIDFFGATFRLEDCEHVTIENSRLLYPSFSRRVLGELGPTASTRLETRRGRSQSNANVIRNCRFEYMDGPALVLQGERGDLIDNCLFHDVDYSCIGDGVTIRLRGPDHTVRRCTIYNTGASECVVGDDGTHIQYCHFYNVGKLQHDGGATQFGTFQEPVEVDHNWSHDHPKNGYRFDGSGGPPRPHSQFGTMHHNVTWNTNGMVVKGDRHLIHNNVVWRCPKGLVIMDWLRMNGINRETVTLNNLADVIQKRWFSPERKPIPGLARCNLEADAALLLRDPANWDFRPRAHAGALLDRGTQDEGRQYRFFRDIEHLGSAPDIGAYELGEKSYWIPGFQDAHASTPIPPDGAQRVKSDADLMFLGAYRAESHVVYFGRAPDRLERQAELRDINIFTPPALQPGHTYYWRVDALRRGKVVHGPVWRFTVEQAPAG